MLTTGPVLVSIILMKNDFDLYTIGFGNIMHVMDVDRNRMDCGTSVSSTDLAQVIIINTGDGNICVSQIQLRFYVVK